MGLAYKVKTSEQGVLMHFTDKTGGRHAKVMGTPGGYAVMEYIGNFSFPALPPKWKKAKTKGAAIEEAKRYARRD
jgi:hypothetical protein